MFREKHTLPHPIKRGQPQRYTINGELLYSPDWSRSPTYNADFIDAVVIAVSAVDVSSLKHNALGYYIGLYRPMLSLDAPFHRSRPLSKHIFAKWRRIIRPKMV
jgi:hypothetical protein